MLREGNN